ncbi:MAG: TatD family hydrolase [Candidatus Nanoarchaeia archaeon]|nr:TatD family hydrolase [Candidatus Nanoarchaeia archaeon]MDD5499624.1 TatD family hydrolase [Candidatus Nanoarchaeia archaeon]
MGIEKHDIHCHLTSKEYLNPEKIIKDCKKQNISIILNGLDFNDNEACINLSKKFSNAYAAMGMHPLSKFDERVISQIRQNKDSIIAIGEAGMDFKFTTQKEQLINLKKLINLAQEINKPMILHSRSAEKELIEGIKSAKIPIILHCFTGKKSLIKEALKNDKIFFSVPASIEYNNQFFELAKEVPINRLFCETDSPYLWNKGLNSPLNIKKAYKGIAKAKSIKINECEAIIQKNFEAVFKNHRI